MSAVPAGRWAAAGRGAVRASTGLQIALILAAGTAVALAVAARGDLKASDLVSLLGGAAGTVAYATIGALVIRRAGNLIGWLMLGESAGQAFVVLASAYSVLGVVTFPGALPAARQVGTLAETGFTGVVFTLAFMVLLFPTGKLPSRRWRPLAAAGLLLAGLTAAGLVIRPRQVQLPAPGGTSLRLQNPFGLAHLSLPGAVPVGTLDGLFVAFAAFLIVAFVAIVMRYRAGGRLLRQQIKWLALVAATFVIVQLVSLFLMPLGIPRVSGFANGVVAVVALFGIPTAMAIAILRERLYDIDVIISRAVAYGLLTAAFTIVYVAIVLGLGTFAGLHGGPVLTIASAVCIAVLFQPLRHRFQRFANRLVYGERATPYQVLADFAENMAGQLDLAEAVERMVSVLGAATGADRAEAWIRVGSQLRSAAAWPRESLPSPAIPLDNDGALPVLANASRTVPVRHSGELLGALSLHKPPNEALTGAEDKLLLDLASQAGLVLRNAQLTADLQATIEELRASRRRLVEAQDHERRKIERNLHDGAQQQLVALRIQLALLRDSADDPDAIRELEPVLQDGLRAALEDLRNLARGIYPPVLAEQGLVAALRAQARRVPLPVLIEADSIGRYSPDTESTAYFCTLEGLQNIAKYAAATQAVIRLACPGSTLTVAITDDGAGFDTSHTSRGSGLQGISDRLAALGGELDIHSRPGHGTTLICKLPIGTQAAAVGHAGISPRR